MTNVKWLNRIEVVDRPFEGYQHERAYRLRTNPDDEGTPIQRMAVRSLLAPPGIPDFVTRRRFVNPGTCEIVGRAWSGTAPITRVEVSVDGGSSWQEAELDKPVDDHAWVRWQWIWDALPGQHEPR